MSRLFCPALLGHFLRRFWPFMAAVAVLLALRVAGVASYALLFEALVSGADAVADPERTLSTLQSAMGPSLCVGAAVACPASALLVFRHMRDRSEAQFYLGMPLSRACLFATCHVSALSLVALPGAAVAVVAAALELAGGYASALPGLGALVASGACALLLFGGLASLSCVATGRAGGAVLAYLCLNVAAPVVYSASYTVFSQFLVGVPLDAGAVPEAVAWLTPVLKFSQAAPWFHASADVQLGIIGDAGALAVYAAAGVALAAASGALYRVRRAEATGETMAFAGSRIAFQVLATLVAAALATLAVALWTARSSLGQSPQAPVVVLMVVFAVVGWIASEMVVRRTPRVFDLRTLRGCTCFAGALVIVAALLAADAFGVVRWVPDPDDVERATVNYLGEPHEVEPADAVQLHRTALEHRELLQGDPIVFLIGINYDMADGSHVERRYRVSVPDDDNAPKDEVRLAAERAIDSPKSVKLSVFGTDRELSQSEVLQVSYWLYDDRLGTGRPDNAWAPFSRAEAYELYRAVYRDIEEGSASLADTSCEMGYLDFELSPSLQEPTRSVVASPSLHLPITPDMEHTLAWIDAFERRAAWQERPDEAGGAS